MFAGLLVALLAVFAVVTTAVVSRSAFSLRVRWLLWITALAGTVATVLCARGAIVRERQHADQRVFDACVGYEIAIGNYKSWLTNSAARYPALEKSNWWFLMVSSPVGNAGWTDCMRKPVVCGFPRGAPPNEAQLDALMKAFKTHDSCTPCAAFPDPTQRPRGCPDPTGE